MSVIDKPTANQSVKCPVCLAPPGKPCTGTRPANRLENEFYVLDEPHAGRSEEGYPLPTLLAVKKALYSGGAQDPELDDARAVLVALDEAGLLAKADRNPKGEDPEEGLSS